MKGLSTLVLLALSNTFMTLAWYGHLKMKSWEQYGLWGIIFISWGIALFEYMLQVPANRLGHAGHGGPFSLIQLKIIQEVLSLTVFLIFMLIAFKEETLRWNHLVSFGLILLAVYFGFMKGGK